MAAKKRTTEQRSRTSAEGAARGRVRRISGASDTKRAIKRGGAGREAALNAIASAARLRSKARKRSAAGKGGG